MTHTKKEREQYNVSRDSACAKLGITKNQYNWFRREGEKLHKLYEDNCNGINYDEKIETLIENEITKKASKLCLNVYFQTDPRGETIYLDTESIPENNYTQAVCIY